MASPMFAMQLLYHTIMYARLVNGGLENYITLDNLLREMSETNANTAGLMNELHGSVVPLLHKMSLMTAARDAFLIKPDQYDLKQDQSFQNLMAGIDMLAAIVKKLPTDGMMLSREKIVELTADFMKVDPLRHGSKDGKVVSWQDCYISRAHLDPANINQGCLAEEDEQNYV